MNGSEELYGFNRCASDLGHNKRAAHDMVLSFMSGNLTPDVFVALLQTQHGPQLWSRLRRVFSAFSPKDVFVHHRLPLHLWRPASPLHFTLAYAAGARFCCRFGHAHSPAHSPARKLPLLCRVADIESGYQQLLAFERVQRHIRCTVLLRGMKRFRKSPVLSKMDRHVVSMIAKDVWDLQFQSREAVARHEEIASWWEDAFTAVFVAYVVCGCALSIWAQLFWSK